MSIPNYQELMLPLLESIADGNDHLIRDVTQRLAERFELTEGERQELLPSGQQTVFSNRVAWAKTYLKKSELLANPSRDTIRITQHGLNVLADRPTRIDNEFLRRFPSYCEFVRGQTPSAPATEQQAEDIVR